MILSNVEIEQMGEELTTQFLEEQGNADNIDIVRFCASFLGLSIEYEAFTGPDGDKIGFLSDGRKRLCVLRNGSRKAVLFPENTIVIDKYLLKEYEKGRRHFTIAHEAAHYILDRHKNELLSHYYRELGPGPEYSAVWRDVMSLGENRADRLAEVLLMPRRIVEKQLRAVFGRSRIPVYGEHTIAREDQFKIRELADRLGVSASALRIRLDHLDQYVYKPFEEFVAQDYQPGDMDDADIPYDRRKGKLSPEKAYLLHRGMREIRNVETRKVLCPVCNTPISTTEKDCLYSDWLKCWKCKWEGVLPLPYFRERKPLRRNVGGYRR